MFVDASAVVALHLFEPDWKELSLKIEAARSISLSAIVIYEASLALARISRVSIVDAREAVDRFVATTKATIVPIDTAIASVALDAFARYGKGRHRAALNMGDCFSYACAKVHRVPLLCKGGDFKLTGIKLA
jgi:ribonuclease VapC